MWPMRKEDTWDNLIKKLFVKLDSLLNSLKFLFDHLCFRDSSLLKYNPFFRCRKCPLCKFKSSFNIVLILKSFHYVSLNCLAKTCYYSSCIISLFHSKNSSIGEFDSNWVVWICSVNSTFIFVMINLLKFLTHRRFNSNFWLNKLLFQNLESKSCNWFKLNFLFIFQRS